MRTITLGELSPKNRKLIFMSFSLACFVAIGVCLIVNIAIDRQITWGAYPLVSIPFGWAVCSPALVKKHGMKLLLCSLTLLSLPYLYCISKITPATGWFIPLGLPSAIVGIISAWSLFLLFRYARICVWYKAAISVFWLGVVIAPAVNYFADTYVGGDPFSWDRLLNAFACAVASAVLGILGYGRSKSKPEKHENI